MTRNIAGPLALLLILSGLLIVPNAAATPASLDCESVTYPDNASQDAFELNNAYAPEEATVARAGNLVWSTSREHKPDAGRNEEMNSYSRGCVIQWTARCTTTGANICDKWAMANDPGGKVAATQRTIDNLGTTVQAQVQHIDPATGNLVPGTSVTDTLTACPSGNVLVSGDGFYDTGSNTIRYAWLCSGSTNRIVVTNDQGTIVSSPALGTGNTEVDIEVPTEGSTEAWTTRVTSATVFLEKTDVATGTIAATITSGAYCSFANSRAPHPAYTAPHAGTAYVVYLSACNSNPAWGFNRITASTWTLAESGKLWGSATSGNLGTGASIQDWDLAGDDTMLVCGIADVNVGKAFAAKVNTDTGLAIDWSLTAFDVAGATTSSTACRGAKFDHLGGFYLYGTATCANAPCTGETGVWMRHYTGGGFVTPPLPTDHSDLYPTTTSTTTSTTTDPAFQSASGALVAFASTIVGPSAGDLFLFGFILVLIIMVILFLITAGVLKAKNGAISGGGAMTAGVIALAGGICMMIFNVFALLWQIWAAAILVILCGAILSMLATRIFASGGGGR